MVSLRFIGASLMAALAMAATTPSQVVTNINTITQKSQALQAPAQSLTIVNGPLIIVGQGPFPDIIRGFVDIVSTASTSLQQMNGMTAVAAPDESNAIFDAFRDFVRVHQQLLSILIGKAGLFNTVPFVGQPVAAVLRQIEGVVDALAFTLIDTVQSRASDILSQGASLDMTISTAIEAFSGLQTNKRDLGDASKLQAEAFQA